MIANLLKKTGRVLGYDIQIDSLSHPNPIRLWVTDEAFSRLYKEAGSRTSLNRRTLYMLYQFAKLAPLGSNFAEIGVFRGGGSYLLASVAPQSQVYSFDTFAGMPETDPNRDWHKKGDFRVSADDVIGYLKLKANLHPVKGFFPKTAGPYKDLKFGLVHIDVDIYQSVKDCLEFFYPRTIKDGVIISDDYGAVTCPGAKMAWDEFFADKPEQSIYLPTRQCFVIKR